jgi:hypothetical protein
MADYVIRKLEEIPDVLGDYPGEMRMTTYSDMGSEQVAFTWRRMPAKTGGKFKLEDDVLDVPAGTIVRIPPHVTRSVWNEGPDDAIVIMCSTTLADPSEEVEHIPDFWPE